MGELIPWTFKTWIVNFVSVDLPIGDLAQDIASDKDFPEEDDYGEICEHISTKCKRDSAILETFALAWGYYVASTAPSGPLLAHLMREL